MPPPNPPTPDRQPATAEGQSKTPPPSARDTKRPTDSTPMQSGDFAKLPMRFGRYLVQKLLGRGAMGAVYLAKDTQLERLVALKIPKLGAATSQKLLVRLKTEAKAAAQIDHPCVCPVFDSGDIDGIPFIAMKFIEGETLKEHLAKNVKGPKEAVELVLHLAEGLAEAHAKKIYHRDLKPENIKLDRRGRPVIMDFGLAKFSTLSSDAGATQKGSILGSPAYMSPEQASGLTAEIDHRSDIYALGVILFEMLTGQWPFTGSAMQVMGQKSVQPAPSPLRVKPDLHPELAAVCHKMIAKERADRWQNAGEVIAALKGIELSGKGSGEKGPGTGDQGPGLSGFPGMEHEESLSSMIARTHRKSAGVSAPQETLRKTIAPAVAWVKSAGPIAWTAIGVVLLLVVGIGLWMGGIIAVQTKEGLLVIDVIEPGAEVFVDGEKVDVTWDKGKKSAQVRVKPGERKVTVTKDGFSVAGTKLTLKEGDPDVFRVKLVSVSKGVEVKADLTGGDRPLSSAAAPEAAKTPTKKVKAKIPPDAKALGNKRYALFTNAASWHEAKKKSQEMGGRLAEIRSKAENDFILSLGKAADIEAIWLGASDEETEGVWLWDDRSPLMYWNWSPTGRQPNNGGSAANEHYLMMTIRQDAGEWSDQPAISRSFQRVGYVCEWDASSASNGFVPLFNGKDLTGWTKGPGWPGNWRVDDGVLIASGPAEGIIVTNRRDYTNFHLRAEVRLSNRGYGQVLFRTGLADTRAEQDLLGGKLPLNANFENQRRTGAIVLPQAAPPPLIQDTVLVPRAPGQWFTLELIAEDNHYVATVDGFESAELIDESRHLTSGGIGLLQADGAVVEIRKIEIRELPAASATVNPVTSPNVSSPPGDGKARTDESIAFFNGTDLTGWDGLPGYWKVRDGAIVGAQTNAPSTYTFLCSRKAYKDFDLKFKVFRKSGVGNNTGVQFRSQLKDYQRYTVAGPQVEIDAIGFAYPPGSVLNEPSADPAHHSNRNEVAKVWKEEDFNEMHIRCVGKHVTVRINGIRALDVDYPTIPAEGIIAWQLHSKRDPDEIVFKDIEFVELTADAKPLAGAAPEVAAPGKKAPAAKAGKPAAKKNEFVPLFNGKDLTGWRTHSSQKGNWRVEKGVLIGSGAEVNHLYSDRQDYENFLLKLDVRINGGGNGGVFFRASSAPERPPNAPKWPVGYEAQINVTDKDPTKTGSLLSVGTPPLVAMSESPVAFGRWFPLEIRAEGNRLIVKVAGKTTADVVDDQRRHTRGGIALQQNNPATVIEFRDIEIKELPAK